MRPYLNEEKLDVVVYTCHPSEGGRNKIGELWSKLAWAKS
jgi:hypothetical protein